MKTLTASLAAAALLVSSVSVQAQTLSGSAAAMQEQHQHAVSHNFGFAETAADVTRMANAGELVRVRGNRDFIVHNVSFPYLRPSVSTLVHRLAAQYHNACGEQLVVTSMTRPMDRQPANSHSLSVHPVGIAFDLRVPRNARCRGWLESTLLSLEGRGVLNVIRERRPPHYHVAVYPEPYDRYLAGILGEHHEYEVRPGDTLSAIAARTNSSIRELRRTNSLRGDLIRVGQTLLIPVAGAATVSATPREVEHEVRPGETLWRIAQQYETSVDLLKRENGLADDLLRVGQLLRVLVGES